MYNKINFVQFSAHHIFCPLIISHYQKHVNIPQHEAKLGWLQRWWVLVYARFFLIPRPPVPQEPQMKAWMLIQPVLLAGPWEGPALRDCWRLGSASQPPCPSFLLCSQLLSGCLPGGRCLQGKHVLASLPARILAPSSAACTALGWLQRGRVFLVFIRLSIHFCWCEGQWAIC